MKLALSLIAIVITENLFAQTKQVTKYDDAASLKERYDVLVSDTSIRQGDYALISRGHMVRKGFYKNNKKDSIWTTYYHGREAQVIYDYTNKKLIDYKKSLWDNSKDGKYAVIAGTDTTQIKLDQPPIYTGGDQEMVDVAIMKTRYPAVAREKNIQGKVIIAFTVDTDGSVSNYRIKKGIGGGCDEEALRVLQLVKGDWLPGMLNGKPVKVEFESSFSFALSIN